MRDEIWTLATQLTLARAILSTATLLLAIALGSRELLLGGLAFSMLLDVLDGAIARARQAETVLGAQLDGVADRLAAAVTLAGAVYIDPSTTAAVAAATVWVQYGFVEQLLNVQFLRFGLWSPDHFYVVSPWAWRLNWSAIAKIASGLPVALIALGLWWPGLGIALALICVRVPSYSLIATAARNMPEQYPRDGGGRQPPTPLPLSEQATGAATGSSSERDRQRIAA